MSLNKYTPLYPYYYTPDAMLFDHQNNVWVQKSELQSVISQIDEFVLKNEMNDASLIKGYADQFHRSLWKSHADLIMSREEAKTLIDFAQDEEKLREHPEFFQKLTQMTLPTNLLKSFMRKYCISETDAILVMNEYFKFLTIIKVHGDGVTPTPWVDEFWHHHMVYDTKQYRDFCITLFGNMVLHNEWDPPSSGKPEKAAQGKEAVKQTIEAYIEVFGYSPPECLWPDMSDKDPDLYPTFVSINLFKTFLTKSLIKELNLRATPKKELSSKITMLKQERDQIEANLTALQKKLVDLDSEIADLESQQEGIPFHGEVSWTEIAPGASVPPAETRPQWSYKYSDNESTLTEHVMDKRGLIFSAQAQTCPNFFDQSCDQFKTGMMLPSGRNGAFVESLYDMVEIHANNYFANPGGRNN